MLSTVNDSTYYINKLKPTPRSSNSYVYLSGFEGEVDIINEQWVFDFKLYLNGNFNIPTNTLLVNLRTPFAEETNIPIVQKAIVDELPSYVEKSEANLYLFNVVFPTSSTKYFDSKLINQKINIDMNFHVVADNLNKIDIPEYLRSGFIKEFDNLRASSSISYTNFYEGKDQGSCNVIDKYYVVNNTNQVINPKKFSWTLNENCLDLTTPLVKLANISFPTNFIVRGYKLEFNYAVEDGEEKKLEFTNDNPKYVVNNHYEIDLPFATKYDDTKKEVIKTQGENNGFFIPKNACGYYSITLLLSTANNWITLKLNKSFNFISDASYQTNIEVKQYFINDLYNFKRMVI